MRRAAVIALGTLILLGGVVSWGLQVTPQPFAPVSAAGAPALKTVPLPAGLPAPVARFYRTTVGEQIPVVDTAVLTARGTMRLFGVPMPLRMRMIHQAGQGYRRYMEATFFGRPLFKFDEWYLDGQSHVFAPGGGIDNDPKMNAASVLAMWAESINLPSIWVTDPRVRWEAVDDTHARLIVPGTDGGTESFTVTFDAQTALIVRTESMRWNNRSDKARRLWVNGASNWQKVQGLLLPRTGSAAWDSDKPWLVFDVEDVVYNVDVSQHIRAKGP